MKKLNLCGTWEMTGEDGRSFPSEVPGSVLNTLLEHGEIPDPFDGMNEFTACAETRRRWCFARSFRVSAEELADIAETSAKSFKSLIGSKPVIAMPGIYLLKFCRLVISL